MDTTPNTPSSTAQAYGLRLKRSREQANRTREWLATHLVRSAGAVAKWESGRQLPPAHVRQALARVLHDTTLVIVDPTANE